METKLIQTESPIYQENLGNRQTESLYQTQKELPVKKHRKKRHIQGGQNNWIWMGMVLSLVFSMIFVACYGIFQTQAEINSINTIESESNLQWLYQNNQVLYRDLYNMQNNTNLNYSELYYPAKEEINNFDVNLFRGQEEDDVVLEEQYELYDQYSSLQEAYTGIENYFLQLENSFTNLNEHYDYMILDTERGTLITNTAKKQKLDQSNYAFYLSFIYDASGNVTVGDAYGENDDMIRKYANELIRTIGLPSDSNMENVYNGEIEEFINKNYPVNCEIIYALTYSSLEAMQTDELDFGDIWWSQYQSFLNAGSVDYYLIFLFLILAAALFLPYAGNGKPWDFVKICKIPLEGLFAIAVILISLASTVTIMAIRTTSIGNSAQRLNYGVNILFLVILFFTDWYGGICLRGMREKGIIAYVKERSLIYRFFPFVKSKVLSLYDAIAHFDVTRNAKKLIIKVVLLNAVILFFISSLWFGGLAITIIYSILLYFILKKYVSDLQKKYSILLSAINEIAQGNLNVGIVEDLGVFEPFKPQIIRIQRGFRNAVEEELKSQRMKAELITNVSHDLKTPLTAIITYIGLLKDESITEAQRREYLYTLERKSNRLKVLIEDLFEVSKATTRNITLNIMDVDIMNLIKQVAFEMSDKLQSSNLDIRMNLTDAKVILPLDSQKTYRIYENLFGNVAKYALPGTRVYINGFVIDDTVVITLKNITAQEIDVSPEELTDRFVRGDTSRNTEGSGLGLAIAKSFTELQNGKLILEVDGDLFKVTTSWKIPMGDQMMGQQPPMPPYGPEQQGF